MNEGTPPKDARLQIKEFTILTYQAAVATEASSERSPDENQDAFGYGPKLVTIADGISSEANGKTAARNICKAWQLQFPLDTYGNPNLLSKIVAEVNNPYSPGSTLLSMAFRNESILNKTTNTGIIFTAPNRISSIHKGDSPLLVQEETQTGATILRRLMPSQNVAYSILFDQPQLYWKAQHILDTATTIDDFDSQSPFVIDLDKEFDSIKRNYPNYFYALVNRFNYLMTQAYESYPENQPFATDQFLYLCWQTKHFLIDMGIESRDYIITPQTRRLILMTDGIAVLTLSEINDILNSNPRAGDAAKATITAAKSISGDNFRYGDDDKTLVVIDVTKADIRETETRVARAAK